MATSENKIIDNATISRGEQGERGPQGLTGAMGPKGATGPAGPIGPSGNNKLDINLQFGSDPFATINADSNDNNWDTLAFFIFAGTGVFTPDYMKIAYSLKYPTGTASVYFRIISITPAGVKTVIAKFEASETRTDVHKYKIGTATVSGLPTKETILVLEASKNNTSAEARGYSLEIR